MGITEEPVTEKEGFARGLPDAHRYLAERQLAILPYQQWYLGSGIFDAQIVLTNWVSKARHAAAKGFAGIRITGN